MGELRAIWLRWLAFALPLASAAPTAADFYRARTRAPGPAFRAADFGAMGATLNAHLLRRSPKFRACAEFEVSTLEGLQQTLAGLADPALLALYPSGDGRSPARAAQIGHAGRTSRRPAALELVHRDGLCHAVVLALVHHLSTADRDAVFASHDALPLLPLVRHQKESSVGHDLGSNRSAASTYAQVFADYEQRVSCQQCHTGRVPDPAWANASLPPPLPVDLAHPGRERLRSCDFQNAPPCGPCDGLGGPRTGDGTDEFTPMPCKVVRAPADVAPGAREPGRYPKRGTARVSGDTRSPVAVRPDVPGNYSALENVTLSLGWDSADGRAGAARQRYDFGDAAQIYLQTAEQRRAGVSGAMVTIVPARGLCVCDAAIAGNMHIDAFVAHEPLDELDLPASEGGLAYLGRVEVTLDGAEPRKVLADHWLKWAFHFLVDADPASATYRLPLRLYGPLGVRQVFANWSMEDPALRRPDVWAIPADCAIKADACHAFLAPGSAGQAASGILLA